MVKIKDISFIEPKKLSTLQTLNDFGIEFNPALQCFSKKLNNLTLLSGEVGYPLAEFVLDYYEMDFTDFKEKFERLLGCKLNEKGYIVGNDKLMSIRDLSYFVNKEKTFAKELSEGRERGTWVNTTHQDVEITTSQTGVVIDFINQSIEYEELEPNDILMLKYLKKIDKQSFSIYKIFNSVDVRDKQSLFRIMNAYASVKMKTIVKI